MASEQMLLEKWRKLAPDKKQEVIDFVEFLESKEKTISKSETISQPISSLGEKLQQIRDKIVASGMPLLTEDEIEKEVAERRGGYQE